MLEVDVSIAEVVELDLACTIDMVEARVVGAAEEGVVEAEPGTGVAGVELKGVGVVKSGTEGAIVGSGVAEEKIQGTEMIIASGHRLKGGGAINSVATRKLLRPLPKFKSLLKSCFFG